MPNVLSPRDLVSRPDNMEETVLQTQLNSNWERQELSMIVCLPLNILCMGLVALSGVCVEYGDLIDQVDISKATLPPFCSFKKYEYRDV